MIIPCHRVVAANNRLGGYSGGDGTVTKQALLRLEGAAGYINHQAEG
jgi:methylated-DNA-[protein]-cysteine S-methyltransferase